MKKCHLSVLWMLLLGSLQVASAQAPPLVAGLGHNTGPTACHHVIDLLLRYGLQSRAQLPNVSSVLLGESIGDLSLVQVSMLDTGGPAAGPTLAITLQNDSQCDVGPFSVSAVATFVRIHPWCPTVTQRVKCVAAGETLELQLQMPHESLAMGQAGGSRLAFNNLVVAIDSFDELVELNEANNLLVIGREAIPLVTPSAEVETAPAPAPEQLEVPAEPDVPAQPRGRSKKVEDIDLDELGLGD